MSRVWSSGFELNSKISGVEFDNFSSTPTSIVTSPVRSGSYAARVNPSATTAQIRKDLFTADQTTVGYLRIYLQIAAAPTISTEVARWVNASGSIMARLVLTTNNTLYIRTAGSARIGSESSALNLGQWYRVEMMVDATTDPGKIELRVDGSTIALGSNNIQGSWARIDLGAAISTSCDFYIDDLAINDNSGSYQNSWPGPGSIVHLRPDSTGDVNTFSSQSGGVAGAANNFSRVSEVTPDNSTTYNGSNTLNQEDLFNCSDAGIGTNDVVNVVSLGAAFTNNIADAAAAIALELEKSPSGVKVLSSQLVPNSASWRSPSATSPYLYPLTCYRDPDGDAWNKAKLDTTQIGYKLTAAGVNYVRVSAVWALVDYVPANNVAQLGAIDFFADLT